MRARSEAAWYQRAVIYELHVRAFYDSDGNGAGDFAGLIEKLDYIQDLGVTAIWLLPFCPSPWRDDGYDVSDFLGVHPAYGCLDDFRAFLEACHGRNLRVITELVLNHTSDQHPWFQRARNSPPGSAFRDFYVWSDTPDRYAKARIIFKDFESSNWTWDPVAGAYYWHRFYSHQPDLNYDSPDVRQAVFDTVDFWLRMGVDGLRLDAVPYLFERDGTICENLPETHGFLRELRAYIDNRYHDRMLLAEANQWPEDAVAYFGAGDECHMAFNFPLMPRLFMAMTTEDSFPVTNIVARTPDPPAGCQWATFLRNHDELTLEMVGDEERDYMYRNYAQNPEARINVGIRRRLASLLGNDRRRIRLMNALLFSLPGTPVIYYGDEIGMGDDLSLGDRNGVRTPMQWSSGPNGGFSKASASELYLPPISDGEYACEFVNVETQVSKRTSLLWWMRQALAIRRRSPALMDGDIEFIPHRNRHVLAFVRTTAEQDVLVVANLSRYAQPVQLPLATYENHVPVEAFGRVEFPPIKSDLYQLSLGPHGFYWFILGKQGQRTDGVPAVPILDEFDWQDHALLSRILEPHLGSKDVVRPRPTTQVEVVDVAPFADTSALVFARVSFTAGDPELQQVPLSITPASVRTSELRRVLARIQSGSSGPTEICIDASGGPMGNTLGALVATGGELSLPSGKLRGVSLSPVSLAVPCEDVCLLPDSPAGTQRNASVLLSDVYALKLFRQLERGSNPDIEMVCFLFEEAGFSHVPAVFGKLTYVDVDGAEYDAGVLHAYVDSRSDLWQLALDELSLYLERVAVAGHRPTEAVNPPANWMDLCTRLGELTAEMHLALGTGQPDSPFSPEIFDASSLRGVWHSMSARAVLISDLLAERQDNIAQEVSSRLADVEAVYREVTELADPGLRIRIHGDFHLGQVLHTGDDLVFIDFEGDSARPLGERLLKATPLVDVAGILHSLRYAAGAAAAGKLAGAFAWESKVGDLHQWTGQWQQACASAFLDAYVRVMNGSPLVPRDAAEFRRFLGICLIAKSVYQLGYELQNRPEWVPVAAATLIGAVDEAKSNRT